MQRRPTVGPGFQKAPFRERLPGTISKLGKGTALQRRQSWGGGGVARVGDRDGLVGVDGSENGNLRVVRGGGSGSGSVRGSGTEWLVGMRVVGESCSGKSVRGSGSSNGDRESSTGVTSTVCGIGRSISSNSSGKSPLTMRSPSVAPRTSSTTARP